MRPTARRGGLVFTNLQKRLLSSVEAFHRTLSVHAAAFGAGSLASGARPDSGPSTWPWRRLSKLSRTPWQSTPA